MTTSNIAASSHLKNRARCCYYINNRQTSNRSRNKSNTSSTTSSTSQIYLRITIIDKWKEWLYVIDKIKKLIIKLYSSIIFNYFLLYMFWILNYNHLNFIQ